MKLNGLKGKFSKGVVISSIIAFVMGVALSPCVEEHGDPDLQEKYDNAISESLEKDNKIEVLNFKLKDAEPWFAMQEEEKKALEDESKRIESERLQQELEAKSIELGNGNFTSGKDFEPGIYNIIAVKGGGNVTSSNMFKGGINAIMGIANDGFYEKEYKNIQLPEGVVLDIDRVTVKLIPSN